MRWLSKLLPQTIPAEAFRDVMSKGWGITHPDVLLGFGVTYIWIFIFLLATVIFFRQ